MLKSIAEVAPELSQVVDELNLRFDIRVLVMKLAKV